MLLIFREYLDNFYFSITGIWLLTQVFIRNFLKEDPGPSILETSLVDEMPIEINLYELALKLPEAPLKGDKTVNKYIEKQAMLVLIAAYEWTRGQLFSKNIDIKNFPDIIKLFKHIRDACAHKNHFFLKDKRFLPLEWRGKKLTSSDDRKKLFSRWMCPGDLEYFFEDVSIELQKLGIS